MPVLDGVSYSIAQPCLDLSVQMKTAGITNLGIVGDLSHQAGCGDHVPWECTGHLHWITAIDIGWGGIVNGVQVSPALLRRYLLPRLRAHTWEFYQIKYIITGYVLNDTRPEYGLRDQKGGDGYDHMHISFLNSAIGKHCTLIQDFIEWIKAGMPDPVTFRPGQGGESEADVSMVALSGGRVATVVRGTTKKIYRILTDASGKTVDDWQAVGNVVVASAVDATTTDGNDLWVVALDPKDKSVLVFSTPDAASGSGLKVQDLGGAGEGGAPGITASEGRVLVTVAGTYPQAGRIYLNIWDGKGWSGWKLTAGTAA